MDKIIDNKADDRFLLLDVMGDEFRVVKKVAMQIPYLKEALVKTQSSERIIIDEVSPDFFKKLIDFIKNSTNISYFKKRICDFNIESVKYWLKYLGMNDLYKTLYGMDYLNDDDKDDDKERLIDDTIEIYSIGRKRKWYALKLFNGKYIMMDDPDFNINDPKLKVHVILKNVTHGDYIIISKDNKREIILDPSLVISDNENALCVSLETALEYDILSYSDEIYCNYYPN